MTSTTKNLGGHKGFQRKAAEGDAQPPQLPTPAEKIDNKLLLNVALKYTSLNGAFFDTKFYAFSRRKPSGLVYAPKAVYANGWLLRTRVPSYFEQLLSSTYGDCVAGDLAGGFPSDRNPYNEEYDYDEDSDLEDDPPDDADETTGGLPPPTKIDGGKKDASGSAKASKTEPQRDTETTSDVKQSNIQDHTATKTDTAASDPKATGNIVVLPYTAFATWNALIFYLCTGEISFNRLRSQGHAEVKTLGSAEPPKCSPKSMYRLADLLGLDELKAKAKADLLAKVSSENILDELLSSFTSSYDDIREAEIAFVYQDATRRQLVIKQISKWIDGLTTGELRHSKDVLTKLILKLLGY